MNFCTLHFLRISKKNEKIGLLPFSLLSPKSFKQTNTLQNFCDTLYVSFGKGFGPSVQNCFLTLYLPLPKSFRSFLWYPPHSFFCITWAFCDWESYVFNDVTKSSPKKFEIFSLSEKVCWQNSDNTEFSKKAKVF